MTAAFGGFLKLSTAATVKVRMVDETDFITPETGLTIAQADIRLSKNGAAFAQSNNAAGATHDENGFYGVPFDTTDTNTLGRLLLGILVSGAAPIEIYYMVIPANEFDSLISGSDALDVNVAEINEDTVAPVRLAKAANMVLPGTVDDSAFSPTTTEFESDDITEATADHMIGRTVIFIAGNLIYQAKAITDYALSGSNGHFTVDAMTEAPANDDTFIIV